MKCQTKFHQYCNSYLQVYVTMRLACIDLKINDVWHELFDAVHTGRRPEIQNGYQPRCVVLAERLCARGLLQLPGRSHDYQRPEEIWLIIKTGA